MVEGPIERDGHDALDVAAMLTGRQLGLQYLDPVAVAIEVITGQQAIAGEFEAQHMAVAAKATAIETGEGRGLVGEDDGVRQQGIGLVPDQERALPHHGICVVKAILGEGDGGDGEVRRCAVHQLDAEVGVYQIPVAVAVLQGKGQAQTLLAVIQALVPDDAIAAVIGQGQSEDGDAPRAGTEGLTADLIAQRQTLAAEVHLLKGALIGAEAHLQVAVHAGAGMEGAAGSDRALGQIRLGQGQYVALSDEGSPVDHPVAREIRHLGVHLVGAFDAREIQAAELPATVAAHQGAAAMEGLATLVDEGDGDALARLHLAGAAAQGHVVTTQDAAGVEIIDVDGGPGVDGDGQGIAGPVAGDVDRVDPKIMGAVGQGIGDGVLPVAVAIHGEHGQHLALQAQGDGGAGLPLALQQRLGVAGEIVHLTGASVALVAEIEGNGGDGVEQGLAGVAGTVAGRVPGIGLDTERAIHQLAGDVAEVGLPDEARQHHCGGGEAVALLINQGDGHRLAYLDVLDDAANDDAGRLVAVDDVVGGLGLGDGDGRQQILIFRIEQLFPWQGSLMIGIKASLRQGRIIDAIHHHEAAGAGADHTTRSAGGRVTGRGLLKQLGRVGPLTDGLLQAGQLGIHGPGRTHSPLFGLAGIGGLTGRVSQLESPVGLGEQAHPRLQLHARGGTAQGAVGIHHKHGALHLGNKSRFLDSQLGHISSNG
ncbi:hypothetical protein D3C77_156300 [compost metagenome]